MKKVYVGLSGGVDSSVAAALLKEQGYEVTGVYMKNWSKDLPGFPCPWKEDYQDAKRVAVKLGIPFEMFDFETEYFDKVVQYMIDGYKAGLTPNPDIMCNQEIKFKLFYEAARERGADYIATGHYARVKHQTTLPADAAEQVTPQSSRRTSLSEPPVLSHRTKPYGSLRASAHPRISSESGALPLAQMLQAVDGNKDQTYFLYRVSEEALQHTLFPLGELTKPQVREEAKRRGLITADKKESMGICFVGKVGIREFLSQYVETEPGPIVDQTGGEVGQHDGAIFYTIGQRHGLDVGGGLPYYVTGKDMQTNTVFVTSDISDAKLWAENLQLTSVHWISQPPKIGDTVQVRTRHRAKLIEATVTEAKESETMLQLKEAIRAATPGQSTVIYDGDFCLGGGIII